MLPYGKGNGISPLSLISVCQFPDAHDHAGHDEDSEQNQQGEQCESQGLASSVRWSVSLFAARASMWLSARSTGQRRLRPCSIPIVGHLGHCPQGRLYRLLAGEVAVRTVLLAFGCRDLALYAHVYRVVNAATKRPPHPRQPPPSIGRRGLSWMGHLPADFGAGL